MCPPLFLSADPCYDKLEPIINIKLCIILLISHQIITQIQMSCTARHSSWHAPLTNNGLWKSLFLAFSDLPGSILSHPMLELGVLYKLPTNATISTHPSNKRTTKEKKIDIYSAYKMNSSISIVPATETSNNVRSRKPLPKRGQIKSRIAANAIRSIVSVLSKASSEQKRRCRKTQF